MDHNSKRQGGLVPFVATLWLALFAAWLFSGEQFLDLVFSMPDAGPIDDWILSAVLWAEGLRAEAGLPDLFAALRSTLHAWTGLGQGIGMISELTRRGLLAGAGSALLAGRVGASASVSAVGVGYLEGLGRPGALDPRVAFVPPSDVDPRYDHAIYVNTAWSGAGMQKMWVLERAGAGWRLALSDPDHWKGAEPAYSWPVSTGKLWPGNNRAGLTPTGIFNIDERAQRHRRGWGSPGMYKAVYIDLHYTSGRVSGVAMHGTTSNMYRRLGQPASHGCVRMTTANADRMWGLIHHPGGATREASERWGEVPRYFASEPADSMAARQGYVRDGSVLHDAAGRELTKEGYRVLLVFFRDDL